jgi:proteic killer suppression protein
VSGIQASHAKRLRMQLAALDTAQSVEDMDIPGFRLHPLRGQMQGRWSIMVDGNWRVTFEFQDGNACVLNYEDYHQWLCTTPLILVSSSPIFTLSPMASVAANSRKSWMLQPLR